MVLEFEIPEREVLGTHEAAMIIAALAKNGVRPYYYRKGNRITFGEREGRTEVFFDDVDEIRVGKEGVMFSLKDGRMVKVKDGEIERAGEPAEGEETLSIPDAAEILGIQQSTIYRWIYAGKLAVTGEKRQKRIAREEVERMKAESKWISSHEKEEEIQIRTGRS